MSEKAEQEVIPEAPNVEGFLAERGTAESLQQSVGVPSTGGALDTITCDDVQIVFCVAHCPSKAIMGSWAEGKQSKGLKSSATYVGT